MPADVTALNEMLERGDVAHLSSRLRSANTADQVERDLNWEQLKLYEGAGFIVSYTHMYDLWRLAAALPPAQGEPMKQTAGLYFLYTLDLAVLDGPKCADPSAPGHRVDQLFAQNQPITAYLRGLPRATRMTLGSMSLGLEAATASLRQNDPVLCSGGLEQIRRGLAAQGDKPLQQVPSAPGVPGKTYEVPADPAYRPQYRATEASAPRQLAQRQAMPEFLTRTLSLPTEPPSMVAQPEWIQKPSAADALAAYPPAARSAKIAGHVTLVCTAGADGGLHDCAVSAESPSNQNFGDAAIQLAKQFRMRPLTRTGVPVAGAKVTLPFNFQP